MKKFRSVSPSKHAKINCKNTKAANLVRKNNTSSTDIALEFGNSRQYRQQNLQIVLSMSVT